MQGVLELRGPTSAEMVPLNIEMLKGKEERLRQRQAHQNLASHDVRTARARESVTCHQCHRHCAHQAHCRHRLLPQAKTIKTASGEFEQANVLLRTRLTIRELPARTNQR